MFYLIAEITGALILMTLVGFGFGWVVRGLRERIKRSRSPE